MKTETIPLRKDVPASDKWDLTKLYKTDDDWEADLKKITSFTNTVASYKGKLSSSSETLLAALKAMETLDRTIEQVYQYASLQHCADESDAVAQDKEGRVMMAVTAAETATSFFSPELLEIQDSKINAWIDAKEFDNYRIYIQKHLHMKPYTLSEKEERILALENESAQTADKTFSLLTNVDLSFGTVTVDGTEKPLTQPTWSQFMDNQNRDVRKEAYTKFYATYENHQNTLASLYAGSVNNDIFVSRARGYKSSLEAALYGNKVPLSVYHNLVETVHANLEPLHQYYELRKKALHLDELRHYDVYVPLVKDVATKTSYDEAV